MAGINWKTSFSAFAGPAKLDATYMVKTTTPVPNTSKEKDETEVDCKKFYDWIECLRADVNATVGIPGETTGILPGYVDDVKKLIAAFFPVRDADNEWKPAIRIKSKNNQGIEPVTCTVGFGNKTPQRELKILDAATALGYIFTVAKHPDNATWQNYYLPLNVLYCRFLYLAFVKGRKDDSTIVDTVSDVPQTSCVMYAGAGEPIRYFYGSTPARLYTPDPQQQAARDNSLQMLDTYRLENVLKTDLRDATNDSKRISRYSPKAYDDLVVAVWTALTGDDSILNYEKEPLKSLLSSASKLVVGLYEGALKPAKFDSLPLAKIKGHVQLGPRLTGYLEDIVRARFLPPGGVYDATRPETIAAWKGLLTTYLFPHMIPQTKPKNWGQGVVDLPDTPVIEPVKKSVEDAKAELLDPFWNTYQNNLLQILETVFNNENNRHPRNPFGRCAETYCVVSMLPLYNEPAQMDTVRGVSLAVTPIGSSDAFKTAFDTIALGKAANASVYRVPCRNCQVLLPLYGIVNGRPHYDEDLFTVPDQVGKPH